MAIVSEVKCGRCDRHYSSVRTHCPYCGARRGAQNKHAGETDNMKGKLIIGIAILAVLIIAVVVLLKTSVDGNADPGATPTPSETIPIPDEDDNTILQNTPLPTDPEPTDDTPVQSVVVVDSVDIRYHGSLSTDFQEPVGTVVPLTARVYPETITDAVPVWTSSDETVFAVVPDISGMSANVTITGPGTATLTVTVGEKTATCIVRGKR